MNIRVPEGSPPMQGTMHGRQDAVLAVEGLSVGYRKGNNIRYLLRQIGHNILARAVSSSLASPVPSDGGLKCVEFFWLCPFSCGILTCAPI